MNKNIKFPSGFEMEYVPLSELKEKKRGWLWLIFWGVVLATIIHFTFNL